MKNKLLYVLLSLSIIILLLIGINLIDINNIKKEKDNKNLESAIKVLTVELSNSNFSIVKGKSFNIKYDKKKIEAINHDNKVEIKELDNNSDKIEITIPEEFKFNQLYIKSNKGNIELDDVTSDFFSIASESGNIHINKLNITNKTDIAVNSSKMIIKESDIHNADVFIADGKLTYDGILGGRSEINTSKGTLDFNLKDKINNYRIEILDANKNIKVNKKIIDNKSYTKGEKTIIINGKGTLNINGDDSHE